jgi:hypothetical protein
MGCKSSILQPQPKPPQNYIDVLMENNAKDLSILNKEIEKKVDFSIKVPKLADATQNEKSISDNKDESVFDLDSPKLWSKKKVSTVFRLEDVCSRTSSTTGECEEKFELVSNPQIYIEGKPMPTINPVPHLEQDNQVLSNISSPKPISNREILLGEELVNAKQEVQRLEKHNTRNSEEILRLQAENSRLKENSAKFKATMSHCPRTSKNLDRRSSLREWRESIKKNMVIAARRNSHVDYSPHTTSTMGSVERFSCPEPLDEETQNLGDEPNLSFCSNTPVSPILGNKEIQAIKGWKYTDYMILE